jgi:nucleotide-binding universal stress UspA family protein
MFRRILIAHDGSKGADQALQVAIDIAKRLAAELAMISVKETPRIPAIVDEIEEETAQADQLFAGVGQRAKSAALARGVELETHVVSGHAVSTIAEFAERGRYDLLVVGFMGHSALYNRLIGSTTDRLVELAPCAVLVVK